MRKTSRALVAAAALAGLTLGLASLHAQDSKARTAAGKPDFSGTYEWPKASS